MLLPVPNCLQLSNSVPHYFQAEDSVFDCPQARKGTFLILTPSRRRLAHEFPKNFHCRCCVHVGAVSDLDLVVVVYRSDQSGYSVRVDVV